MKVLLNPASSGRASTFGMDLELATYITPNERELSALYPNQSTEEICHCANEKQNHRYPW
ncbi:MAG: hypothetical protein ACLSH7_00800 [Veillonella parvula]